MRSTLSPLASGKSREGVYTAKEACKVCVLPQYSFSSSVMMTVRRLLFSISPETKYCTRVLFIAIVSQLILVVLYALRIKEDLAHY